MIKLFSYTLIFCFSLSVFSQKIEKETKVPSNKIPNLAKIFIENAVDSKKVKWYFEKNEHGNSYEAKFKLKRSKTSIEFDLQGNLQDVEIEISNSKIPRRVQKKMSKYFKAYFSKFKIQKIQKQFRGIKTVLLDQIRNLSILKKDPTFYEIVVFGKSKSELKTIEFLFDISGNLISSKTVIQSNTDHIAY